MRNNIILLLIITVILISSCTDEYNIAVINKSSYPIDFKFTTGYRLGEYRLEPEGEWHYSLSKTLGHSMGTFTSLSTIMVDYRYSDYVYTFYNAYTLAFDANGGIIKRDEKAPDIKAPDVLVIVQNDKIQMPACVWEKWNQPEGKYYIFSGWAENPAEEDEENIYLAGSSYTVSEDINNHKRFYALWK
ncbi:hypothetical protein [Treponema sp. R8-4-B8]